MFFHRLPYDSYLIRKRKIILTTLLLTSVLVVILLALVQRGLSELELTMEAQVSSVESGFEKA